MLVLFFKSILDSIPDVGGSLPTLTVFGHQPLSHASAETLEVISFFLSSQTSNFAVSVLLPVWVGQLLPKRFAQLRPQSFLRSLAVPASYLCLYIGRLGVGLVPEWIFGLIARYRPHHLEKENFPPSRERMFDATCHILRPYIEDRHLCFNLSQTTMAVRETITYVFDPLYIPAHDRHNRFYHVHRSAGPINIEDIEYTIEYIRGVPPSGGLDNPSYTPDQVKATDIFYVIDKQKEASHPSANEEEGEEADLMKADKQKEASNPLANEEEGEEADLMETMIVIERGFGRGLPIFPGTDRIQVNMEYPISDIVKLNSQKPGDIEGFFVSVLDGTKEVRITVQPNDGHIVLSAEGLILFGDGHDIAGLGSASPFKCEEDGENRVARISHPRGGCKIRFRFEVEPKLAGEPVDARRVA